MCQLPRVHSLLHHYDATCLHSCKGHTCTLIVAALLQEGEAERAAGARAVRQQSRSVAQCLVNACSVCQDQTLLFLFLYSHQALPRSFFCTYTICTCPLQVCVLLVSCSMRVALGESQALLSGLLALTPQCSWHLQAPAAAPTVEAGSFPPRVPPEVAEIQEPAALDMLRALQTSAVAVPAMGAEVRTTYVTNAEEGSSLRGEPCSGQYMPHQGASSLIIGHMRWCGARLFLYRGAKCMAQACLDR